MPRLTPRQRSRAISAQPAKALERYNAKRRFDLTAEPHGELADRPRGRGFVVQQHDATRMHYDFRLELDGVLLSWAVPKGPSLSPSEKRLAVQTEDHPVTYRNFEGNIPHGEYGGGPVIVWDRGQWKPEGDPREGLRKGHLSFDLAGEKLRGRFSLVRTRGAVKEGPKSTWLLFKRSDEHVREGAAAEITARLTKSVLSGRTVKEVGAALTTGSRRKNGAHSGRKPDSRRSLPSNAVVGGGNDGAKKTGLAPSLDDIEPQLATLVDRPPATGPWVYEIKFDGYRMLARIERGKVQLRSRNRLDWTKSFPAIAEALSRLDAASAVLDGELCYLDEEGRTRFQLLQNALPRGGTGQAPPDQERLVFYLFDVLYHDGIDLRAEPLADRKHRLRILLGRKTKPPLVYSDHLESDGHSALNQACAAGLEGLIAKRSDAPYRGGRGSDWLKLKCHRRQEFVIVGMTEAGGNRTGFRSLLLAVRDNDALVYRGKVGTGFNEASLKDLSARLRRLVIDASPLKNPPRLRDVVWVRPELVCEVEFAEITQDGSLRHPSFQGLREDKRAAEVVQERPLRMRKLAARGGIVEPDADTRVLGLNITHPERVIDSRSGLTKLELARYHEQLMPLLLPYAQGRFLSLVRCPQGDAQKCFFQKQKMPGLGDAVKRARAAGHEVLYVNEARGILELVQFNAVELHAWGSRAADWKHPDWFVIDLDPDVSLNFGNVVDAALEVREQLARIGLKTFVKTTGGKGLHVVAPLKPAADWDTVKSFTQAIAVTLAQAAPERYVATLSKAQRKGRIFVDYLRNGQGATAVLPYSPRARPGATVAMPVEWKELTKIDPKQFTVRSVLAWLKKRRKDPWADFFDSVQRLPGVRT